MESLPGCNFGRSPGPSGGVKIDPQTALGEVQMVLGGSWRPLGSSGGLFGAVARVLERSRSRLGGVLGPKGSHFGALLGSLFGTLFVTDF